MKISPGYNYYTIDQISYQKQNGIRSEEMPISKVFQGLIEERKSRKVKLYAQFYMKEVPHQLYFVSEPHGVPIYINGKQTELVDKVFFEKRFNVYDIANIVRKGVNKIELEINFYQSDHVYHVLLDDGVTESLKNALTLDTELDCFYLAGDFGVFGADSYFESKGTVVQPSGFYLDRMPQRGDVTDIVRTGFPFYSGEFTFETQFETQETNLVLFLEGRVAAYEVWVNDKFAGKVFAGRIC